MNSADLAWPVKRLPASIKAPLRRLIARFLPLREPLDRIDFEAHELEILRFHAAVALGNLGPAAQAAVPALIHTALWDEDAAVRVEAAVALWKIDRKGPLAIPALADALADENELICWMAADSLGQIGPEAREAVPALQGALRRPFKIALVRKGVALALQRVEGQSGGVPNHEQRRED